jgi:ABC-type transport system involved in cytochrome c biogenesis permease subunit
MGVRRTVRAFSSLAFGAFVLVCLLVAMAAATVYESMRGTEQALVTFYQSPWFIGLLGLLCLNLLGAMFVRFPWPWAKLGFVVTHTSIVVILIGALITKYVGIEGQVALFEGESASEIRSAAQSLVLMRTADGARASVELPARPYAGLEEAAEPGHTVELGALNAAVLRYIPDSTMANEVVDGGPAPQPAVLVSLARSGTGSPRWVFAGHRDQLRNIPVSLSVARTDAELDQWTAENTTANGESVGKITVAVGGSVETLPVEECRNEPKPVLDGRYRIRVLDYFPHATVGADGKVTNASPEAKNPAVRVDVVTSRGVSTRLAFSNFPDFQSMHGGAGADDLRIVFQASGTSGKGPRIDMLAAPQGAVLARLIGDDGSVFVEELHPGSPVSTPWAGSTLELLHRYDRAWVRPDVTPVDPPRETRDPAILVALQGGQSRQTLWLQRHQTRLVTADGTDYQIAYRDRTIPLGFDVALDKFTVGYYPGGRRPRSFESQITISDPSTGRSQARVVSMNHPTTFDGYTFYQSSYRTTGGRTMSVLSVAWDPGQVVVFVGYFGLLGGMLWVLGVRVRERRRAWHGVGVGGNGVARPAISLLSPGDRCAQNLPHRAGVPAVPRDGSKVGGPRPTEKSVPQPKPTGKSVQQQVSRIVPAVVPFLLFVSAANAQPAGPTLPSSLELSTLRGLCVQHDGRWMPLETLARDIVHAVTGRELYRDRDPVLWLLAWSFDSRSWAQEPLITIRNAELRRELQLAEDRTTFSYNELINHGHLRGLMDNLANVGDRKLDPLESKVSGIHEKLIQLQAVFAGRAIRVIPDPKDPLAAWAPIGADEAPPELLTSWRELATSFIDDKPLPFAKASMAVVTAANSLPAAHRPTEGRMATELRYNRLQPFGTAWKVMFVGALLAAAAIFVRRRWFDALAFVGMLGGFLVLTYGLSLRWQIAGRIPASNMFESLLFLSWGMGAFAVVSVFVFKDRLVPLTASGMGAAALLLANILPVDHFIRPIAPVLLDTVWMSIHVPVIMVSYSVLALAVLIAHVQLVMMALAPKRTQAINLVDGLHYWYVHVGSILLAAGIITGSMWAASSWGRYWGWDPKEVWSLVALLGYLTILHVRIDHEQVPLWVYVLGAALCVGLLGVVIPALGPMSTGKMLGLLGAVAGMAILILAQGQFATAAKSVMCFWLIIMTYVGVNYVLGIGLHSYGFGTGAVARYMFLMGGTDLAFVALCTIVYRLRRERPATAPISGRIAVAR